MVKKYRLRNSEGGNGRAIVAVGIVRPVGIELEPVVEVEVRGVRPPLLPLPIRVTAVSFNKAIACILAGAYTLLSG